MQWFLIRRLVELLLGNEVVKAFGGCHNGWDVIYRFQHFDFDRQVGLMVCAVIAGSGLLECIWKALVWIAAAAKAVITSIAKMLAKHFRSAANPARVAD